MARESRTTKQKKELERLIEKQQGFFTADDLCAQTNIAKATIYRFLKDAKEQGMHSYHCFGKTIYSNDKKSHCHFTCEKCGSIEHITLKNLDFLSKKNVCHVQIDITGVCERCDTQKK